MEQEQSSQDASDNNQRKDQQAKVPLIWTISSTATAIHVFLLGVFLLWIFLPDYVPDRADRAKVFIESIFSLGIVIVVVVHAMMYYKQAKAMDAQVQQTERAVQAAQENVNTVKETSVYANRAYVTAKIRGISDHQWRLRIENSGGTPANNVCVYYSAEFGEDPPWDMRAPPFREMPEEQIIFDTALMETARLGVIAPNSSYHVIRTPKVGQLSPEDKKRWILGDIKFFCWGAIVYDDIFKRKRYTYFCFFESQKYPHGYPCEHGNQAT